MGEVLHFARYKQQGIGINLCSVVDFTKENIEKKTSTSSQPDYLPSPTHSPAPSPAPSPILSPESGRKYSGKNLLSPFCSILIFTLRMYCRGIGEDLLLTSYLFDLLNPLPASLVLLRSLTKTITK